MVHVTKIYKLIRQTIFMDESGVLGLFCLSTLALFVKLVISPNFSKIAWITTALSFAAAWKRINLTQCIHGQGAKILLAFLIYAILALVSCLANPETLPAYSRVGLWAACLWSGYVLASLVPEHGYAFMRGTIAAIVCGTLIVLPIWYLLGMSSKLYLGYRLELFTGHPSRLALYSSLACLYSLHESFRRHGVVRWLWLCCAFFLNVVVFYTNSRTFIFILPLSIALYGLLRFQNQTKRILAITATITGLAVAMVAFNSHHQASQRLISAVVNLEEDQTFRTRLPIWEVGLWAFRQSPWIGNGLKSYLKIHARYAQEHRQEWAERYPDHEPRVSQAHNMILGRLVETGVLGATAFIAIYGITLFQAIRARGQDRWVAAFFILYLLTTLVDDSISRVNDSFVFFLFGIIAGHSSIEQQPSVSLYG